MSCAIIVDNFPKLNFSLSLSLSLSLCLFLDIELMTINRKHAIAIRACIDGPASLLLEYLARER